jgi:SSS family solute:Na+ symporter
VGVQWRASWYPGQEPGGGGGYIAQRMMSARDERHSFFPTLWFTTRTTASGHGRGFSSAWRRWCCTPGLADKEAGYVVMRDFLPAGWRGMLSDAFFAAYMSTISTQLNWGTSYIVNDFYRRFARPDRDEQHYVTSGSRGSLPC